MPKLTNEELEGLRKVNRKGNQKTFEDVEFVLNLFPSMMEEIEDAREFQKKLKAFMKLDYMEQFYEQSTTTG